MERLTDERGEEAGGASWRRAWRARAAGSGWRVREARAAGRDVEQSIQGSATRPRWKQQTRASSEDGSRCDEGQARPPLEPDRELHREGGCGLRRPSWAARRRASSVGRLGDMDAPEETPGRSKGSTSAGSGRKGEAVRKERVSLGSDRLLGGRGREDEHERGREGVAGNFARRCVACGGGRSDAEPARGAQGQAAAGHDRRWLPSLASRPLELAREEYKHWWPWNIGRGGLPSRGTCLEKGGGTASSRCLVAAVVIDQLVASPDRPGHAARPVFRSRAPTRSASSWSALANVSTLTRRRSGPCCQGQSGGPCRA